MTEEGRERQQALHDAIERCLADSGELDGGEILTAWAVVYELTDLHPEGHSAVGHFYGPRDMTTWRALGLFEWVRRYTLGPDEDP